MPCLLFDFLFFYGWKSNVLSLPYGRQGLAVFVLQHTSNTPNKLKIVVGQLKFNFHDLIGRDSPWNFPITSKMSRMILSFMFLGGKKVRNCLIRECVLVLFRSSVTFDRPALKIATVSVRPKWERLENSLVFSNFTMRDNLGLSYRYTLCELI